MNNRNLNIITLFVACIASAALGPLGCMQQEDANSISISKRTKSRAVLLSPPRQHYEVIDPQDGMFVTYWERYYDQGDANMDLFPNGYRSEVDYTGAGLPTNTNNVSGKGKRQCWGDVIDWTLDSQSGVHSMRVYGWLEDPLVEYYIGRTGGRTVTGEYNTSRGRYRLHVQNMEQENVVNPEGDPGRPLKFLQFNVESLDGADAAVGPVDLGEHFAGWETLMTAWWPLQTDWIAAGWSWNTFTRANYCVVATELFGNIAGYAKVIDITVSENSTQMVDGSCNGVDNDGDGSVDEDWVSGFCILPPDHPTCAGTFGTTICSGGVETCIPEVAGTVDNCDGVDNDCDGTIDEDFTASTRNCGSEVGRCQNTETSFCAGSSGVSWGACEDGLDPITEVPCNFEDDDCDGRTDEGSINLPIRCVLDRDEDGIEDDIDVDPDTFSNTFAEGDFGLTSGEIINRSDQTVVALDLPGDEGVWIETLPAVPPGGTIDAEISLCGGTVNITMGAGENQVVTCPKTSCLFADQQLTILDRGKVWSDFYAGNFTLQYDAKVFAAGLSTGNGHLFDRAEITNGVTLGGTLTGNRPGANPLVEGAAITPQVLRVFSIVSAGTNIEVPDDGTETISPGEYGDILVGKGGTLVLDASGTYRFHTLVLESDTRLDLSAAGTGQVVLAVEGDLILGDRLAVLGDAQWDIHANGTSVVVGYDAVITADIQAPLAHVEVKDRARVNGCIGGRDVTLGYDTQLYGESSDPGSGTDPAILSAHLTTTGDWGGDYCVTIDVTNSGGSSTAWVATVNTGGSSIYDTWNASYSGTWGTVTATPNQSYNIVIDPGETDTSVGFCAHRWFPGQMATLVSVVPL
ncbi:MAG: glycoside hydrolase family 11 protein [Deltaproteobacteria bacterium]|nr:glycoside hydrolase family 11 protein [Deltaproteobacteria bacterium]